MQVTAKLGYGVGQFADGVKQASFSIFVFFYYNQVLGLSGTLAGAAALLALIVDALTDPMIGEISDRFRSRWGRRHPFMLAGALPFWFAFAMLFNPPAGLSEYELFAWLLGWAITLRIFLTLFFVPHLSLGAELARGYHERTSLIGYRVFFSYAGVLVTSVVGFAVFFPRSEQFANGLLNPAGYPKFGLFVGVISSLAMLLCVVLTRKHIPNLLVPEHSTGHKNASFAFLRVISTLKEHAFRILFFTTLSFNTLAGVTQTLLIYLGTYVLGFESQHLALLSMSLVFAIFIASPIAQFLSRRIDKKHTLAVCISTGALFAFSPTLLFLAGLYQQIPQPIQLGYVFTVNAISQAFFIAYMIMLDSMLTDTIDQHEYTTGRREEGLFFAARSLATKASYGLGSLIAGIALDIIDFPRDVSSTEVSAEAIHDLAILAGPFSMALFLLTILISSRYPLNAARHAQLQKELAT